MVVVQEATDDLLTRQFTALSAALGDDVPAVRIAAVAGVCTVLDAYWELIPAATTAAFVQRLASGRLRSRNSQAHSCLTIGLPVMYMPAGLLLQDPQMQ
jgi:hypothetical protein